MNKIKNFNLKKFLTLIAAFTLALCLAFSVACGGNTSSSTDSGSDDDDEAVVNPTDYQTVKNGDFEFGTFGDSVSYPVYTGVNWTRYRDNFYSTSAISSSKNSGIIDTEDEAYNAIASAQKFPTVEGSEEYWNPRTPAYYGFGGQRYEEEDFESNPNEDKLVTKGSKILMIHNVSSESGRGTAQKFVSSSSLTTTTGYGKLSVWVLTKDLKTLQDTEAFGAYISVNNTLSSSRNPFLVKNINTNGLWAEYVIYLKTSDYAKSSFTVTVGLGFGSDDYKAEYVEGFAYFDDIHYEEIDKATFQAETASNDGEYSLFDADNNETTKKDVTVNTNEKAYEYGVKNTETNAYEYATDGDKKVCKTVKYVYSHLMDTTAPTLTFTGEFNDVPADNKTGESYGYKAFNELESLNLGVTNTYGDSAMTAYVNLTKASSFTLTSAPITIAKNDYKQYNFLVYVKVGAQQTGATVEVEELDATGNVLGDPIEVAADFDTYNETDKDYTWKKVNVFVSNNLNLKGDTNTERYIRFKFTLGTTEIADFNQGNYDNTLTKGFALFTGFEERNLPEEEYNVVSSEADYKSTITLGNEFPNGPETDDEEESTDYAFTSAQSTIFDLKTGAAKQVSDYTGVVANHTMVGGTNKEYGLDNVISGVVSSKYASNYGESLSDVTTALNSLKTGDTEIQPLLIKNTTATAYGYLGTKLTFSANTTTLVSVQVKVLKGTAYVYLANADPLSNFDLLNVTINATEGNPSSKELFVAVSKDSLPTAADKWVTVNFLITTGDEDISYRVELWNGSRDGQVQSQGAVLFNHVEITSAARKDLLSKLGNPAPTTSEKHTRATSTVKYTDTSETDKNGNPVEKTRERSYLPTVVYEEYANDCTIIATYETIHAPVEIDETTASDDDTDDDDTDSDDTSSDTTNSLGKANWALQLTSIIIAAILVVVLIVVLIRVLVKKNKRVVVSKENHFDNTAKTRTQATINKNKAARAQKEFEEANGKTEEPEEATEEATEETLEESEESQETVETENTEESEETTKETTEETAEEKPYDYTNPENNI